MKKLLIFFSAFILAACGGGGGSNVIEPEPEPTPTPTPEPEPEPELKSETVLFNPSLNEMTRATDTRFESGDRIGVFAVESTGDDSRGIIATHGNYANNVEYRYDGSRFVPAATGIEVKKGTRLYYTAVYPYATNYANAFTFDVKTDQSVSRAFTQSDLCTASTNATDNSVVDLKFSHRLSKIVVRLTGTGWTSGNISVKLNSVLTSANIDLNTLAVNATGSKQDIVFAQDGTLQYKAILPPQTIPVGEKLLTMSMNGVDYSVETLSAQEYRSGKQYEYTINLDENGEIVEFTGDINPWNVDERIYDVVPPEILPDIEPYIPIYRGTNPPVIEGTIFVDPFTTVFCKDYPSNGGFAPGYEVSSSYIRFSNQNTVYNTLDIDEVSVSGNSASTGTGAFISGSGNNFTAYFNTIGQGYGISTKTALVISGTKVSGGIANLKYAFVMVDKGDDPENKLMGEGVFRVLKDGNDISEYATWPGNTRTYAPDGEQGTTVFTYNK